MQPKPSVLGHAGVRAMADTKWTAKQREAIETVGCNILVSAAAGSGKTSVLAERCAYLVCDAPAAHRCDVSELLVVTFTEAAAAEMRARIAAALADRYAKNNDDRLALQLALIDRAQISTLHAFCLATIRLHFHVLGIDPGFTILSEEEGLLLRTETARQLFEDRYTSDREGAFQRFIDRYGDGNDAPLRQRVIRTHELLSSIVKPHAWIHNVRSRLEEAATHDLPNSELGKSMIEMIRSGLTDLHDRCAAAAAQFDRFDELTKQKPFAAAVLEVVEAWQSALENGGIDALAEAAREELSLKMPPLRNASDAAKSVRGEVEAVRDELKKGPLRSLARFTCDEWRDGMRRIAEPASVLLDLVEEFGRRYAKAKDELRVLDFSDLERLALRVLSEQRDDETLLPSAAARAYREQFKHVLVDEYQDINELQDAILAMVSRDGDDTGNFFCVGDVKQSIYRFRLAEPKRFLDRHDAYRTRRKAGTIVDLQTNFRSRAPLLDALNRVFERLMTREAAEIEYDRTHFLRPPDASPFDTVALDGPHVELHLLPRNSVAPSAAEDDDDPETRTSTGDEADDLDRTEREAAFIATEVNRLVGTMSVIAKGADGSPAPRPLRFGDVAILLRSMRFKSEQFAAILRRAGVPVHCDSGTGFFESMEVRDVLALLKVLDNPRQDVPLAAVLRSPIAAMPNAEDALARVRLAYNDRGDHEVPFHEAVARYAREHDDELAARLRDFLNELSDWREMAHRRPLADVLWTIYDASGYLAFCEGLPDGEQRVANLTSLHERARQFGAFRRQGLGRFMRFLDSLRDESDLGQPSVASEADDVVRIMSIHRSKGLEFPVVIVPDLGKAHNLSDARGHILVDRECGIGLDACDEERRVRYPSLASVVVAERVRRQMLAEELRVLYVATTRAREKLLLVGTCKKGSGDELRDGWLRRWAAHSGTLPAGAVLGSSCMLDWIGPAWAAMQAGGAGIKPSIELRVHDAVDTEHVQAGRRQKLTERQQALAALLPLDPAPAADATADMVWNRLATTYQFRDESARRAANSVTALSKSSIDAGEAREDHEEHGRARADEGFIFAGESLRTPRTGAGSVKPTAADVGAATHVLLEHLDFSRTCVGDDLKQQVQRLVERKQVTAGHAAEIDLPSVEWFVGSDLGRLLRQNAEGLRREVAINFPMEAPNTTRGSTDPMDRVMIRGRLDVLLLLENGGAVIVDFKTDRFRDEREIQERLIAYGEQLRHYARAVVRMLTRPVARACVVFLHAKQVCEVSVNE